MWTDACCSKGMNGVEPELAGESLGMADQRIRSRGRKVSDGGLACLLPGRPLLHPSGLRGHVSSSMSTSGKVCLLITLARRSIHFSSSASLPGYLPGATHCDPRWVCRRAFFPESSQHPCCSIITRLLQTIKEVSSGHCLCPRSPAGNRN